MDLNAIDFKAIFTGKPKVRDDGTRSPSSAFWGAMRDAAAAMAMAYLVSKGVPPETAQTVSDAAANLSAGLGSEVTSLAIGSAVGVFTGVRKLVQDFRALRSK